MSLLSTSATRYGRRACPSVEVRCTTQRRARACVSGALPHGNSSRNLSKPLRRKKGPRSGWPGSTTSSEHTCDTNRSTHTPRSVSSSSAHGPAAAAAALVPVASCASEMAPRTSDSACGTIPFTSATSALSKCSCTRRCTPFTLGIVIWLNAVHPFTNASVFFVWLRFTRLIAAIQMEFAACTSASWTGGMDGKAARQSTRKLRWASRSFPYATLWTR
mmetsp:Transcript_30570/g.99353  ORF Transcript_30570/g.99353 Transcript_30570/m.99353 type:complete len:218 (-) Transcript_30570:1763-2416(-)